MSEIITYRVHDMSCEHCKATIGDTLVQVAGVEEVEIDLETKLVRVRGLGLDESALRAAIEDAGYEAT